VAVGIAQIEHASSGHVLHAAILEGCLLHLAESFHAFLFFKNMR
jgi:hypothetical protein